MIIFFSFYFLFFYFFSFIYLLFIIFFYFFPFFPFKLYSHRCVTNGPSTWSSQSNPCLGLVSSWYTYIRIRELRLPPFEWIHSSHKCARTYTGVRMREGNNRMKLIIDRQGWKRGGKKKRRKKNTFWSVLDKMEFAFHAWWFSSTFLRFIFF